MKIRTDSISSCFSNHGCGGGGGGVAFCAAPNQKQKPKQTNNRKYHHFANASPSPFIFKMVTVVQTKRRDGRFVRFLGHSRKLTPRKKWPTCCLRDSDAPSRTLNN